MRMWLRLIPRVILLLLLAGFLLSPQSFDFLFRPLVQANAPAIYNQGDLATLTLLHVRMVLFATLL